MASSAKSSSGSSGFSRGEHPNLGYGALGVPEGSIIATAKSDAITTTNPEEIEGLEWCPWCQAQDEIDKGNLGRGVR